MEEEKKKINNVCFHKCHEFGKERCNKCQAFHRSSEGVATHPNDKENPSY